MIHDIPFFESMMFSDDQLPVGIPNLIVLSMNKTRTIPTLAGAPSKCNTTEALGMPRIAWIHIRIHVTLQ